MGVRVRPATARDVATVWKLVNEFAVYLGLEKAVTGSHEALARGLSAKPPQAECLVAEVDGTIGGYALYFPMFSSFRSGRVLFLEDLYVSEAFRGRGLAKALLARLARITLERGWHRMEWYTGGSNVVANALYQGIGSKPVNDTVVYRLADDELKAMAELDVAVR